MSAPSATELISQVATQSGFEKTKVGSGDKDVGYKVKESTLGGLIGSLFLCFVVMGFFVVGMVYDIHLEKKTYHRQLRVEEHHAASKLAEVQMELWSQYRDDVSESKEASLLLKQLEAGEKEIEGALKIAVGDFAKELNLHQDRSQVFADRLLHLVSDMQKENIKHARHLLSHLVDAGKRGEKLEKRVEGQLQNEMQKEQQNVEEDGGAPPEEEAAAAGNADVGPHDPLKAFLDGFWFTFNDYEREFGGKAKTVLKPGNAAYDQLRMLHGKITAAELPSEDISEKLSKIDLSDSGVAMDSGRVLPPADIVEELVMIPKIQYKALEDLEKDWKSGAKDSVAVFAELQQMRRHSTLPSGWMQLGVNHMEEGAK